MYIVRVCIYVWNYSSQVFSNNSVIFALVDALLINLWYGVYCSIILFCVYNDNLKYDYINEDYTHLASCIMCIGMSVCVYSYVYICLYICIFVCLSEKITVCLL